MSACLDGGVVEYPYKDSGDAMSTTYQKIRVTLAKNDNHAVASSSSSSPSSSSSSSLLLNRVLAWLAVGKSPAAAGYAVDVLVAPVFGEFESEGCAAAAYTTFAWRAGNAWPLNLAALGL